MAPASRPPNALKAQNTLAWGNTPGQPIHKAYPALHGHRVWVLMSLALAAALIHIFLLKRRLAKLCAESDNEEPAIPYIGLKTRSKRQRSTSLVAATSPNPQ